MRETSEIEIVAKYLDPYLGKLILNLSISQLQNWGEKNYNDFIKLLKKGGECCGKKKVKS